MDNDLSRNWNQFRSDIISMKMFCKLAPDMNDQIVKIDSLINLNSSIDKQITNTELVNTWNSLHESIMNPTQFFELGRIIKILEHIESILEQHSNIKLENVTNFSLFISALCGLKESWEKYLKFTQIPLSLSQYDKLIGEMFIMFRDIFNKNENKDVVKDLKGIEAALFSLQSMITNFPYYEKMVDSANRFSAELSCFCHIKE